ncbi:hypothetical protein [Sphingomicrobium nitratireducens]|uniref:hypothetical protein n=1 Tax=Sphingomicrobium nitratireducens TaxID=2964666 RepID=UPI00224088A6|nr:hypothetical protein [Sphingomicrobium nitratireducens]
MRAIALLALALAACAPDQAVIIDGSDEQKFVASAAAARSQLPIEDRMLFDRALNTVGGRRMAERDVEALRRRTFDGMTAYQVVADARARGME